MRGKLQSKFKPLSFCFSMKNTQLYILGCKTGCLFCKILIFKIYCGEGGIRTPGTLQYNGFQDRRDRPLCHLSNAFVLQRRCKGSD